MPAIDPLASSVAVPNGSLPGPCPPLPGTMLPSYDGYGISSLPATFLCAFGGAPTSPPLRPDVLPPSFFDGIRTVVFILIDGLGLARYEQELQATPNLRLAELARNGIYSRLTSVLPSTTTTALATLSTGLTPQEHGLIGYKLYLREVGEIANMIRFSPVNKIAPYARKRINPQSFFDHVTLYQQLLDLDVRTRVIIRSAYANTPLSRMFYRGAEVIPHGGTHDAFVVLRRLLEQDDGSRQLIYLYWDPVDNVSHHNGPNSDEVSAEIQSFDYALRHYVLDQVRPRETALIITADHGHIHTTPSRRRSFNKIPGLMDLLERPPFGDSRLPYLACRPGREDELARLFEEHVGDMACLVPTHEALQQGWFGIGSPHPELYSRLGTMVVPVANGCKLSYHYSEEEFESIGCHGGVDPEEMLVPFIALRLE